MVRFIMSTAAFLLLLTPPAHAQVGKKYREFRSTEFARFFNVTTKSRKDLEDGGTTIRLEPGGHQKHIDIVVNIDRSMTMHQARLSLSRSWIGDGTKLNPFARDIAKSFLADVSCAPDDPGLKRAVEQIWHAEGSRDNVVKTEQAKAEGEAAAEGGPTPQLEVFLGSRDEADMTVGNCRVTMKNAVTGDASWLHITVEQGSGK